MSECENPFFQLDDEAADVWTMKFTEKAQFDRLEAIDCCVEGIKEMASIDVLEYIIEDFQKSLDEWKADAKAKEAAK
jgi:hypothetical protein